MTFRKAEDRIKQLIPDRQSLMEKQTTTAHDKAKGETGGRQKKWKKAVRAPV
jgi:hypothetical protein